MIDLRYVKKLIEMLDGSSVDSIEISSDKGMKLRISKGQIVCIIEAMKILNEIESEYDGIVREVLAENAHPVEYGQPLYRIDPA